MPENVACHLIFPEISLFLPYFLLIYLVFFLKKENESS